MENEKHIDTKPEHLWESRGEYQEFYLSTFRDHLHQEKKTKKYLATLKLRDAEKRQKAIEKASRKAAAAKKAAEREKAKRKK